LFTIARNLHLRRGRRDARLVSMSDEIADRMTAPADTAEHRATIAAVESRLLRLSDDDRAAFRLRVEGCSYAEIAAALGLTEGAARVRVHRVRAALAGIR
jgi:RNA polymerase sigma factor (sigma-70 family)